MKLFMSVKKKDRTRPSKETQNNKDKESASFLEEKKICSFCAEGAYCYRLDPKEVFCPYISCLREGNCPKFRKLN